MIQDVLVKENMVYRSIFTYLHGAKSVVEVQDKFGNSKHFERNPKRPKKVHSFFFRTKHLLELFEDYEALFKDYPYFKVNITQAKVMPYITYDLKDKSLIDTKDYQAFKKLYNEKYGSFLEKMVDKTSRMQCYRLKGTVSILDMKEETDVQVWMDEVFEPVMKIKGDK